MKVIIPHPILSNNDKVGLKKVQAHQDQTEKFFAITDSEEQVKAVLTVKMKDKGRTSQIRLEMETHPNIGKLIQIHTF